jgi:hypothetical protein
MRARCANLDPRRANRLRNPVVRLAGEYVVGFVSAVRRAPLSSSDRGRCYLYLALWMASRVLPGTSRRIEDTVASAAASRTEVPENATVSGRLKVSKS